MSHTYRHKAQALRKSRLRRRKHVARLRRWLDVLTAQLVNLAAGGLS